MVRERRKSFYLAQTRITETYDVLNAPSQSTIIESKSSKKPRKRADRQTNSPSHQPLRSSNRLKGISVPEADLVMVSAFSKRRSNKASKNASNRINEEVENGAEIVQRPQPIKCRRVTVALERLNTDTINEIIGARTPRRKRQMNSSQQAHDIVREPGPMSPVIPSGQIGHVSPRKITKRRLTVNLERIDLSEYADVSSTNEHRDSLNEKSQEEPCNEPDQIQPISCDFMEDEMILGDLFDAPPHDESERDLPSPIDFNATEDSGCDLSLAMEIDPAIRSITSKLPSMQIASKLFEGGTSRLPSRRTSSIISDQNIRNAATITLTPSIIVSQANSEIRDRDSQKSTEPVTTMTRLNWTKLMYDEQDNESCIYNGSSLDDESTNNSQALVLYQPSQDQQSSSQLFTQNTWTLDSRISVNSIAVEYSRCSSDRDFFSGTGFVEPKKCFMDSPHITYGAFVQCDSSKFAVNCFDHGDDNIQYHFLSKFNRKHFSVLGSQFKGRLYTTDITARLMSKYSNINQSQVHVMTYGREETFGNTKVTAIEVPQFPGGALFLFEAKDKKSIVHVGDFRLPKELEFDSTLINSDITQIQFDESILSSIFYQFKADASDRYMDLMAESCEFNKKSKENGLTHIVAIGAFELGMESLILLLAVNFGCKVYMSEERREFLKCMDTGEDRDTPIQRLLEKCVDKPINAFIHVLPVEEISMEHLINYITKHNYQRVLGIRPRGCDTSMQKVTENMHKIVDVPNPLIGDIVEYERFVRIHAHKDQLISGSHFGKQSSCQWLVPSNQHQQTHHH